MLFHRAGTVYGRRARDPIHGSCIEKNFRMSQYEAELEFVKNRKKRLRKGGNTTLRGVGFLKIELQLQISALGSNATLVALKLLSKLAPGPSSRSPGSPRKRGQKCSVSEGIDNSGEPCWLTE